MKTKILGLLAVALLAGPMTATAASFSISLFQNGLGDAGADWFGTFEAPETGGVVTAVNIVVGGIVYDGLLASPSSVTLRYDPSSGWLSLFVFPSGYSAPGTVLQFSGASWALSDCGFSFPAAQGGQVCGGGNILGTYAVGRVPEPGTLALLGLGLAGLGLSRRRKANRASAAVV